MLFGGRRAIDSNEYEKIRSVLRRYSFESKMQLCFENSIKLIDNYRLSLKPSKTYLPWELDVFAVLSLLAIDEWKQADLSAYSRDYENIMIRIRNMSPSDRIFHGTAGEFPVLMQWFCLQQFSDQEDFRFRLYRYWKIFTYQSDKIDMASVFSEKHKTCFEDILQFTCKLLLLLNLANQANCLTRASLIWLYRNLCERHAEIINLLSISRSDYVREQEVFLSKDLTNILNAFVVLNTYPFIGETTPAGAQVFLPIPYRIIRAITDGLMHRLTEGNNSLHQNIAKNVFEPYVHNLLKDSGLYDEVHAETLYIKNKTEARSPDVMARKKNSCLLIDTKISSPSSKMRRMDTAAIEDAIITMSKHVIQMYNQINEFAHYNPFYPDVKIIRSEIYGVIALLEDNYISREAIYFRALENLNVGDNEREYIIDNIKIVGIKDIEAATFKSVCYVDSIKKTNTKEPEAGFSMNDWAGEGETLSNEVFTKFIDLLKGYGEELRDEIQARFI